MFWAKLICGVNKFTNFLTIKHHKVNVGKNNIINGKLKVVGNNNIDIGKNVTLNSGIEYNPVAGDKLVLYAVDGGSIKINDGAGISNSRIIAVGAEIRIEKNVLIGAGTQILTSDFHALRYEDRLESSNKGANSKNVIIGEGAFIGTSCIILKGVRIGRGSVIGAGSVVTKDVPDGEVWAGNPASFIRKI